MINKLQNCLLFLFVLCVAQAQAQTQNSSPDRFKQLDKNNDGELNAEEVTALPSLARLLSVADADKDGSL